MRTTLVSIMTDPSVQPRLVMEQREDLPPMNVFHNRRVPYGLAFQEALRNALQLRQNLVLCDGDGYHRSHDV